MNKLNFRAGLQCCAKDWRRFSYFKGKCEHLLKCANINVKRGKTRAYTVLID